MKAPLALALACAALPCALAAEHGWPVSVSGTSLTNSFGEDLGTTVSSNTALNVSSDVHNGGRAAQDMVYIVQVKDGRGAVLHLNWLSNSLAPGASANMSISWTPAEPGQYQAEIFVWESLSGQVPLSGPVLLPITVG